MSEIFFKIIFLATFLTFSQSFDCRSPLSRQFRGKDHTFNLQALEIQFGSFNVSHQNDTVIFQLCQAPDSSKIRQFCGNISSDAQALLVSESTGTCHTLGILENTNAALHLSAEDATVNGVVFQMSGDPSHDYPHLDCSLEVSVVCGSFLPTEPELTTIVNGCKYAASLHSAAACPTVVVPSTPSLTSPPPVSAPPTSHSPPPTSHSPPPTSHSPSPSSHPEHRSSSGVALGGTALMVAFISMGFSLFTAWKSGVFEQNPNSSSRRRGGGGSMLEDILLNDD
mmetsp:Transcript_13480/g.18469  ORF Transcript_13480/g.18469 Transcript_13480/m.18469 type:complete len:282 (-) Transcript_13480:217-1062(-)|eukprot:CAMPEP_0196585278 /NCGR_PEP_ID=MMETSP1081-20130531/50082_1 /TAXON_ID=36882 /ORGANISM="Pyramimonas amylifera, Strain CCMP720" /LENGTH=281 /DNA_ID=CAMNT_0041906767 /DNA_START=178 /DNA_END=1023 /DNA_ORIENTATION=+